MAKAHAADYQNILIYPTGSPVVLTKLSG